MAETVDHRAKAEKHAARAAECLGYEPGRIPHRLIASHQQQAFLHLALATSPQTAGGEG